jgi:hypothetical protein
MRLWHSQRSGFGVPGEPAYWLKADASARVRRDKVVLSFHEGDVGADATPAMRKAIYVRTAYRNDPGFNTSQIQRMGSLLEIAPSTGQRMIDNDVRVAENYQRMVAMSLADVYGGKSDDKLVRELRESYIGILRDALLRLFPDLELIGPGDPLGSGTFYFKKGAIEEFPYMNLSGGEKAAFDLLLDLVIKTHEFDDTVICIDEPEAHLNTRTQSVMLDEMLRLVNDRSQLWIASHSIGMMRRAQELRDADPESVAFLDFEGRDFDGTTTIEPESPSRAFWSRTLEVAIGDLAALVAPSRVVLCEGLPLPGASNKAEFDARCYRRIFGDTMPETQFLSVGNNRDVEHDSLRVGQAISTLVEGTQVVRVIDRDMRTDDEVEELAAAGVRVLSRRHLEAFLLDDEVLGKFCEKVGRPEMTNVVLGIKGQSLAASVDRGTVPDDVKSAADQMYAAMRQELGLTRAGSDTVAFMADTLAPLITPDLRLYEELRRDIFG